MASSARRGSLEGRCCVQVWPMLVIAVGRSRDLSENLRSLLDALSRDVLPVAERARELAVLSAEDLHQQLPALESLPFIERVRIQGLISKYRDEHLGRTSHWGRILFGGTSELGPQLGSRKPLRIHRPLLYDPFRRRCREAETSHRRVATWLREIAS